MKKIFNKIAPVVLGALLLSSCGDFGDINDDPNHTSQAYTEFLFAYSLKSVPYFVMERSYNPQFLLYPRYIAERQNVQYGRYNINDFSTEDYYKYTLMNLKKVIDMNTDEATKNTVAVTSFGSNDNQIAAAKTLSCYYYLSMTDILGGIAYSEALDGDNGNFTPKLDSQKDVYTQIIADLNDAYSKFDESGSLNSKYEYVFKGDISKWKKLNASLRMLAAIKLSDVDPETGKAWFQKAYNEGGITANDDNFSYPYYADADNENPLYTNIVTEGRKDFSPSSDIVNTMNDINDPRRPAYFTKNQNGIYKGIPLGIKAADVTNYNKDNSDFNSKMYVQNAPFIIISSARMLLIEAEAAVRGWITADAGELYEQAINQSIAAKFELVNSTVPSATEITNYIAQDGVKFGGTDAEKIALIAKQRWINGYFEDGVEAWADWRRLDAPTLTLGPAALVKHIPYRCVYSSGDVSFSPDQYDAIIKEQGENTVDTRLWWDTKDNAPQN